MIIRRGKLTGNRNYDNNYIKENTKSESIVKYAEAIIAGKEKYPDLKDVQPIFRLHPPLKGHKGIKKGFRQGGDLGYRGDDINNLILKMLGPVAKKTEAAPAKKAPAAKKPAAPKAAPKKTAEKVPAKKALPKVDKPKAAPAKKPAAKPAEKKAPVKKEAKA